MVYFIKWSLFEESVFKYSAIALMAYGQARKRTLAQTIAANDAFFRLAKAVGN